MSLCVVLTAGTLAMLMCFPRNLSALGALRCGWLSSTSSSLLCSHVALMGLPGTCVLWIKIDQLPGDRQKGGDGLCELQR
jgi:hypothetical protein